MRNEKGHFVKGHPDISNNKGRIRSAETREKIRKARLGKPPSNKGKSNIKALGSLNHKWISDRNLLSEPFRKQIMDSNNYKQWRNAIFERDHYTCVWCNGVGGKLNADHIIPFSAIIKKLKFEQGIDNLYLKAMNYDLLWDTNNGRTLCVDCHKRTDTYGGKSKKITI